MYILSALYLQISFGKAVVVEFFRLSFATGIVMRPFRMAREDGRASDGDFDAMHVVPLVRVI